jgi:hypothetical protein
MQRAARRGLLVLIAVIAAAAAVVPAADASISPTLSLSQSAGDAAGSTTNLGLDLKFTDTGTDSPRDLTINLPPGLLANASTDGGACLRTANTSGGTCEVGSGTVTATADPIPGVLNLPVPVSVPVTFYLVPPPAAGDLAGLAVEGLGEQIGSTGDVKIRATGDADGVGVSLYLVLPDQLPLTLPGVGTINTAQISLTEINSTFVGLRYPATCPATPASLSATVDSYGDATIQTVTAPLHVTGCSSLPYSPIFKVSAARDRGDRQVTLETTITQSAAEAPSRSVSLAFPASTLVPNLESIQALCLNLASGTCPTVGSVSATSPLYPTPLSGKAYLTGSSTGLALTLVFPSPFPLTLTGSVDLVKNSATFTGLPDIPLTNLRVSLGGGTDGLFLSTCQTPSGTAIATLTDQNGDRTVQARSAFTVSGCPSTGASGGGSSSGASGIVVGPTVSTPSVSGLATGHPSLILKVRAAGRAARLDALTIELPAGLSFSGRRAPTKHGLTGITLIGATARSLLLTHGHLLITLRKPAYSITVKLGSKALTESPTLKAKARANKLPRLILTVIAKNSRGRRIPIHIQINDLQL